MPTIRDACFQCAVTRLTNLPSVLSCCCSSFLSLLSTHLQPAEADGHPPWIWFCLRFSPVKWSFSFFLFPSSHCFHARCMQMFTHLFHPILYCLLNVLHHPQHSKHSTVTNMSQIKHNRSSSSKSKWHDYTVQQRYCSIMPLCAVLSTNMFAYIWNTNHSIITRDDSLHQIESMELPVGWQEKRRKNMGDEAWYKSYGPWRRRKEELTFWVICYCLWILLGYTKGNKEQEILTFAEIIFQHQKSLNYYYYYCFCQFKSSDEQVTSKTAQKFC